MKRETAQVPFGYEPPVRTVKGVLVFYDSFDSGDIEELEQELAAALETARQRSFTKLVLYPLHEETLRRMTKTPAAPYHKREKTLIAWKQGFGSSLVTLESWEGRRKKYTPFEAAVRHLEEIYGGPLFLYVTPEMANRLAGYDAFKEAIKRIRLILSAAPEAPHPNLEQFRSRWDVAGEALADPEERYNRH
ncbi:hypothetical protein AWM70_08470 [Paenibacillus yonginensis]|uniref:Uncharacterized protein n=1 Tax=Paenibacillus yonginensis TaxID=1462996 RepID=A0A1B1MZL3_9BACL|nr:hypothetical protein [Paenibacillus yonginensis]ANS74614.1 hypothetical protein AWM70_08470 [Paenibacillus yonginensis]